MTGRLCPTPSNKRALITYSSAHQVRRPDGVFALSNTSAVCATALSYVISESAPVAIPGARKVFGFESN